MTNTDEIIQQFIKDHPNVSKVEWLPEHEDLTIWFKDAAKPDEPFGKSEFIKYTRTWYMFDNLQQKLMGA